MANAGTSYSVSNCTWNYLSEYVVALPGEEKNNFLESKNILKIGSEELKGILIMQEKQGSMPPPPPPPKKTVWVHLCRKYILLRRFYACSFPSTPKTMVPDPPTSRLYSENGVLETRTPKTRPRITIIIVSHPVLLFRIASKANYLLSAAKVHHSRMVKVAGEGQRPITIICLFGTRYRS